MQNSIRHLAAIALTLGVSSLATAQTVIYRETFGNNTGGNLAPSNANITWNLLRSETNGTSGNFTAGNLADDSASSINGGSSNGANSTSDVSFSGLPNVNAGTSLSTTNGFTFVSNTVSFLAYTSEYTIDRSAWALSTATWNANRNSGAQGGSSGGGRDATNLRFAAQVGGSWYVADYTPNASNIGGTTNTGITPSTAFSVNLGTATWYALTANVGAPISVAGTSTALPSGNVTAFGLLGTSFSNGTAFATVRFDNFAIQATAIPEPSAFAAIAGLGALGFVASRRRRRA